jgi:hypothetical protein
LAPRAVLWLAVVPSTFFLSAVYPESLFMALALGAFLCALDGRWVLAGVLGACAAVTRDYGVVLLVPLGWEYLQQHRCRPSRDIAWLLLIPAAFTGWQVYLWILSGDPLAMSHAAEDWGRRLTAPWDMFRYYLSPKYWETFIVSRGAVHDDRTPLDLVATLLLGILVALSWRLQRRSLAVLATVLYLPMISTGGFVSIPRYGLEVFPIYLVLARMTARGWMLVPALVVSAVVAVVAMSWFAVGGWIA